MQSPVGALQAADASKLTHLRPLSDELAKVAYHRFSRTGCARSSSRSRKLGCPCRRADCIALCPKLLKYAILATCP